MAILLDPMKQHFQVCFGKTLISDCYAGKMPAATLKCLGAFLSPAFTLADLPGNDAFKSVLVLLTLYVYFSTNFNKCIHGTAIFCYCA